MDSAGRTRRAACSFCGVGCGLEVHTTAGPNGPVIAKVVGDKLHPTNSGRLCTKGASHADLADAVDGRMDQALVRRSRNEPAIPTETDDAVAIVGRRLRVILDEHGPDSIALYVSGQMSIEAQYLANKLAKGFIRTTHIESNSRLCMASAGTGYKQSLGADGPPGSYDDFDNADLFFVIGSNMADCHPILYLRMADRLRAGAKLIVVDPRRTATAADADLFLQIKPGTDLALLNGLLHLLVASGAIDHDFIAEHTDGWDAMPDFLADYTPAHVAEITGIAEADIRVAASMISDAGEWMTCWTMGLNQSTHGTWNTNAICNLHLATGAICRPGSGPMSLTGQPNAMGGREMGYMGPGLPGQRSVTSADDRTFVEQIWELDPGTIRDDVGPGTIDMFGRMADGDIKACWIICTNPVATVPNRDVVIAGLEAADLVVTQDAYRDTATNRYADVVLPAASWAESDAVMVNSERTLTLIEQCVPPLGDSRPDWQLICQVADAMGFGEDFRYDTSEEIFDEIRRFWNPNTGYDLRGVSYQRLREAPVQWPCPPEDDASRHPTRYLNDGVSQHLSIDADGHRPRLAFPTPSRRARFHARPHIDAREMPDDDYPFVLNTGRLPHQWHTMTKTGTVAKLNKLTGRPFVEVNADDAALLGISEGQAVELRSRRGRFVLPAVVTDRVLPGNCFAPMHWNDEQGQDLAVNVATSDAVDPDSLQPELKFCAIAVNPLDYLWHDDDATEQPTQQNSVRISNPDAMPGPLVLWASQTGNAEDIAIRLTKELDAEGIAATLMRMADCAAADLVDADVVLVTSTFGDGGPPDSGTQFWHRLRAPDMPTLPGTRFAVLGIGDRSFSQFCAHAKSLDKRFASLGASRFLERLECEIGDVDELWTWTEQIVGLFGNGTVSAMRKPNAFAVAEVAPTVFSRASPIVASLRTNRRLTPLSAAKEVRQFGFDISGHDVSYDVGDALGVHPTNNAADVENWLIATRTCGDQLVEVDGAECTWRDALTHTYDIGRVTPDLVRFLAESSHDKATVKRLRTALSDLGEWQRGRNGIDVAREFPVDADIQRWQEILIRLTPRFYSISSSPLISPDEIRLLVSIVRYRGIDGIGRGGVCSTFLADRAARASVFLQRSPHFHPPEDPSTPMVMIGAGTGISPFHGFLQHRRALGHSGRNWLFFGDRHASENFYHREDLMAMVGDGHLTKLDVAFSRDQQDRIYVQHKMIKAAAELWSWLESGAHIYVCGDATYMAKDVDDALTTIIRTQGRMSKDAARDYKFDLIAAKRYVRDVY